MKILIAADKFKGSMSGREVGECVKSGLQSSSVFSGADFEILPIADGGEGMASSLIEAGQGRWVSCQSSDALGNPIECRYGLIEAGRTAVIEMAEASGLWRMAGKPLDPWNATSFGTGALIRDATHNGARTVILGIGGSATNEAGAGMAEALGFRFLDRNGEPVRIPADLGEVETIKHPESGALPQNVRVACDVSNPLLGAHGATRVYGPQKGIGEGEFARHEQRFSHLVDLLKGASLAGKEGAGAAGGLGFGAMAFLGAELVPGFDLVADAIHLADAIDRADLIVTGEGKIDAQSLQGKGPVGVAEMASARGKPVVAFCGVKGAGDFTDVFQRVFEIRKPDISVEQSIRQGKTLLTEAAQVSAEEVFSVIENAGGN